MEARTCGIFCYPAGCFSPPFEPFSPGESVSITQKWQMIWSGSFGYRVTTRAVVRYNREKCSKCLLFIAASSELNDGYISCGPHFCVIQCIISQVVFTCWYLLLINTSRACFFFSIKNYTNILKFFYVTKITLLCTIHSVNTRKAVPTRSLVMKKNRYLRGGIKKKKYKKWKK